VSPARSPIPLKAETIEIAGREVVLLVGPSLPTRLEVLETERRSCATRRARGEVHDRLAADRDLVVDRVVSALEVALVRVEPPVVTIEPADLFLVRFDVGDQVGTARFAHSRGEVVDEALVCRRVARLDQDQERGATPRPPQRVLESPKAGTVARQELE
jgi:hypothetical protein